MGLTLKAPTPPIREPGLPTADADIGYRRKATWAETMRATRTAVNDTHLMPEIPLGSAVATKFWRDFPREADWLMQDSEADPEVRPRSGRNKL